MRDGAVGWTALIVWLASLVGVVVVAERRGRRGWRWLLLAIPFGVLAFIPLLISPRRPVGGGAEIAASDGGIRRRGWSRPRRWLAGSAAVVAVLLLAALAYFLGTHQMGVRAAIQAAQATGSPCTVGSSAQTGEVLIGDLLPEQGALVRAKGLSYGVLSLRTFVGELYSNRPSEGAFLRSLCFQAAVHDAWRTPDGVTTSVWLIRFANNHQARAYTLETEQGDLDALAGWARLDVPGVGDGMLISRQSLDAYGNTETRLLGDRADTAIIIHLYRPAGLDQELAIGTLRRQFSDLGPGQYARLARIEPGLSASLSALPPRSITQSA